MTEDLKLPLMSCEGLERSREKAGDCKDQEGCQGDTEEIRRRGSVHVFWILVA